jgi:hypothetical protein
MIKLLKKGLLFFVLIIIVDNLIGFAFDRLVEIQKANLYYDIEWVKKNKPDILIFGTSKAKHNYIPQVITGDLHYTCYNLGQDGSNVIYHYTLIKYILSIYSPKLIIYDVAGQELDIKMANAYRYNQLLPIIKNDNEIINLIENQDKYIRIRLASKIYPYNGKIHTLIRNTFSFGKEDNSSYGYRAIYGSNIDQIYKSGETKYVYREENEQLILKEAFTRSINLVKHKNIKLLLINSPQWNNLDGSLYFPFSNSMNQIIESHGYNVIYINKENFEILNEKALYKDLAHLNENGSKIFSVLVNGVLINLNLE